MKKINIVVVLRDHFSTLRNDKTGRLSLSDIALFYGLPCALGLAAYLYPVKIPTNIEGALIAVFSVFAALLFSAQIALYSLTPKEPDSGTDAIQEKLNSSKFTRQREFFRDVNYNVSYLILLSCLFLIAFIGIMVAEPADNLKGAILSFSVSHFFLTLLMLVKRTHVAFSLGHSLEH